MISIIFIIIIIIIVIIIMVIMVIINVKQTRPSWCFLQDIRGVGFPVASQLPQMLHYLDDDHDGHDGHDRNHDDHEDKIIMMSMMTIHQEVSCRLATATRLSIS